MQPRITLAADTADFELCRDKKMLPFTRAHVKNERALGRAEARIAERRNADAIVVFALARWLACSDGDSDM